MNNTAEHTIRWETINGKPVAHLSISRDFSFEELRELGRQVYSTLAAMEWSAATLLEVGSRSRGDRVMHLLHKSEYETNHDASALCGKPGPWEFVEVLRKASGLGGICKKCRSMQEFAVTLHPVEEGEHGSM